jgi:hypothetical protein
MKRFCVSLTDAKSELSRAAVAFVVANASGAWAASRLRTQGELS